MTVSQLEAEPVRDEQSSIFEDNSRKTSSNLQNKRNPPARNTSRFWFERFLAVIQRQNPLIIDVAFVGQIAPSNEGKLLAQLKFLGVIDEQGKPTRLLPMLNMVGEEQKKAFREISNSAYMDLQTEVKVDKAVPDDLVNFFIRKYGFTRDKAINAARFYMYLAEKGGIAVSEELGSFLTEKTPGPTVSNGIASVVPRISERPIARSQGRETKSLNSPVSGRQNHNRKFRSTELEERSPIQAVINIKLEKDTPKEYWDRVLALLGEKQLADEPVTVQTSSTSEENIEQELSS
ncbi:MAG TPA: DUF5343 domain-containing protein, partial [Nitrososphaerales archaeon]|nr:DUF5343 domain-containing protein [Nitrososphaerales archaeon]